MMMNWVSYQILQQNYVKTEQGKTAKFATRLGAEKMFYLLDDDGFWNVQYSKETFTAQ